MHGLWGNLRVSLFSRTNKKPHLIILKENLHEQNNRKASTRHAVAGKTCREDLPVWRYSQNPILGRRATKNSNSVFNSAVVPFRDGYAGVFRCDSRSVSMDLFAGFSKDGLHWNINDEPIVFSGADPEILKREYRYDARVCYLDGHYYITWCNGYHGPTIGVAYTDDFKTFTQLENAFLPYNRNGVLFPRKIGGEYMMLSRPSDTGTRPSAIFLSAAAPT